MTQIKSEKAKALIDKHWNCVIKGMNLSVGYKVSLAAVIIAETEAEERYAKQLQELKGKAVEAFIENYYCTEKLFDDNNCEECYKVHSFTPKLNEQ